MISKITRGLVSQRLMGVQCKLSMRPHFHSAQRFFAAAQAKEKDFYKVLGIESYATNEEIKSAYRSLAKKYHPDVRAAEEEVDHEPDVEKFRDVVEAYQVLSVRESRAAFDITRKKNPHIYETPFSEE